MISSWLYYYFVAPVARYCMVDTIPIVSLLSTHFFFIFVRYLNRFPRLTPAGFLSSPVSRWLFSFLLILLLKVKQSPHTRQPQVTAPLPLPIIILRGENNNTNNNIKKQAGRHQQQKIDDDGDDRNNSPRIYLDIRQGHHCFLTHYRHCLNFNFCSGG